MSILELRKLKDVYIDVDDGISGAKVGLVNGTYQPWGLNLLRLGVVRHNLVASAKKTVDESAVLGWSEREIYWRDPNLPSI